MENALIKNSSVECQTSQGFKIRAPILRLNRYMVTFEINNLECIVQTSEVLNEFEIKLNDRTVYSGRAVIANLVNTGTVFICEATLDENWYDSSILSAKDVGAKMRSGFNDFLEQWQRIYKVLPEFKVVMADMQTFLMDLRLWMEHVELEIRSAPAREQPEMEQAALLEVGKSIVPAFDSMHQRLEEMSEEIEPELRPVHQNFSKRQLHSLVMCAPFAYRTYHKPLGYAGDYEMVNMMMRNPFEGNSLYAKVVNLWFISQWPSEAHRNRVKYLKERLTVETARMVRKGKPLKIFNLGCGPAKEIQEFIADTALADNAEFTLLDFNKETIEYTGGILQGLKRQYYRKTSLQFHKKSVAHVLKEGSKGGFGPPENKFDYIYCAGLFDYLSDQTCKQLMNVFYDRLAPGGLLVATNVDDCKPFRHMLEFVLDWHLIYRDQKGGAALIPNRVAPDERSVKKDPTEVNVFIEARKPEHG
ncbi:MAG: hypothetical protein JWQ71_4493 [Pedosphaera sp.]|nr:hypothetical protein [Pedosphaera sp.]